MTPSTTSADGPTPASLAPTALIDSDHPDVIALLDGEGGVGYGNSVPAPHRQSLNVDDRFHLDHWATPNPVLRFARLWESCSR